MWSAVWGEPVAPAESIAAAIRARHGDELGAIQAAADAVVETWTTASVTERERVVDPLERGLRDRGVLERLPAVLETVATVLETSLVADPVPAPPYVVVTSRGPVLRATMPRRRVVITVAVFQVNRGSPVTYERREQLTLDVDCRER